MLLHLGLVVAEKTSHNLLLHRLARLSHGFYVALKRSKFLVKIKRMRIMQVLHNGQRLGTGKQL